MHNGWSCIWNTRSEATASKQNHISRRSLWIEENPSEEILVPSLIQALLSIAGSQRRFKCPWKVVECKQRRWKKQHFSSYDSLSISCESRCMQFVIKLDSINLALLRLWIFHKKWEIQQLGKNFSSRFAVAAFFSSCLHYPRKSEH